MYELRVKAALPLLALKALTALNRACSQLALSAGGGGGAAVTVTAAVRVTLPAELVAVQV